MKPLPVPVHHSALRNTLCQQLEFPLPSEQTYENLPNISDQGVNKQERAIPFMPEYLLYRRILFTKNDRNDAVWDFKMWSL